MSAEETIIKISLTELVALPGPEPLHLDLLIPTPIEFVECRRV